MMWSEGQATHQQSVQNYISMTRPLFKYTKNDSVLCTCAVYVSIQNQLSVVKVDLD